VRALPKALSVGLIGLALLTAAATPALADVLDAGPNGFTVRSTIRVGKPAAAVYAALTQRVAEWWNPDHSWSGEAKNLSIDARPGGCFCEKLPNGGGVQHMMVIYADPGKRLRMSGGLGPLQTMGVAATWSFEFVEVAGGTSVDAIYTVGGYAKGGLAPLAQSVDAVTRGQLDRLEAFLAR